MLNTSSPTLLPAGQLTVRFKTDKASGTNWHFNWCLNPSVAGLNGTVVKTPWLAAPRQHFAGASPHPSTARPWMRGLQTHGCAAKGGDGEHCQSSGGGWQRSPSDPKHCQHSRVTETLASIAGSAHLPPEAGRVPQDPLLRSQEHGHQRKPRQELAPVSLQEEAVIWFTRTTLLHWRKE